jgi:hypothetical protein
MERNAIHHVDSQVSFDDSAACAIVHNIDLESDIGFDRTTYGDCAFDNTVDFTDWKPRPQTLDPRPDRCHNESLVRLEEHQLVPTEDSWGL